MELTKSEIQRIRSEPGFKSDELRNIADLVSASDENGNIDVDQASYQIHQFNEKTDPRDLFSAFHNIRFRNHFKGCVIKSQSNSDRVVIRGSLTLDVLDDWNFSDPNKGFRLPFNTLSTTDVPPIIMNQIKDIQEEEFRQLELSGYALPFKVTGSLTERVTITLTAGASAPVVTPNSGSY